MEIEGRGGGPATTCKQVQDGCGGDVDDVVDLSANIP